MDSGTKQGQAVGILQELGLKEYEAKCFVALSRMPRGTAKEISETTDVPRTRVYDAIRVLEAKGLVEVQHSNPQQFRAVPIDEALQTLQDIHESQMDTLRETLEGMEPVEVDDDTPVQEVWALSDSQAIANRTQGLVEDATDEVVIVIGEDAVLTDQLVRQLERASERITVLIGALTEPTRNRIQELIPDAEVFVSGLEWLHGESIDGETSIGRLLLVDREAILVSSWEAGTGQEHAIYGTGFSNGLVVISRRLMATGLFSGNDRGAS